MSNGVVTQIIGAVIDVEFDRENIPNIYEALNIVGLETVLEVQQQLGDGIVRTIAMGSTEGLKRGLEVVRTNAPISVPVGQETLGRIMDVLGNPSMKREISARKKDNQFIKAHQVTPIRRGQTNYWKQALRLST